MALIAACTQGQGGNSEAKPGFEEDYVSAVEDIERPEQASYVPKYKSVKEALDACGVDSFWVNYFPITIHVNSKECYIWPPIGETLENYAQTFSPNFEKFYKLLNTYKNNYEIQSKYYEENHKFIGE